MIANVVSLVTAITGAMANILDGGSLTGTTKLALASIYVIPILSGIAALIVRIVKRAR